MGRSFEVINANRQTDVHPDDKFSYAFVSKRTIAGEACRMLWQCTSIDLPVDCFYMHCIIADCRWTSCIKEKQLLLLLLGAFVIRPLSNVLCIRG